MAERFPAGAGRRPVTAGHRAGQAAGMLTETSPTPRRTAGSLATASAVVSGAAGLLANVLLVLFFLLARPLRDATNTFTWLGPANDIVVVVQFAAFVPVALALATRLPRTRSVRTATAAGVVAMIAVAVLQALLVAGTVDFDVQVILVSAVFLVVFGWVFVTSATAHRVGALPRPVTRFGLLLGMSYPLGVLVAAPGLLFAWGSAAQFAFVVPGVVLGSLGWLGLPAWPLLLARPLGNVDVDPPPRAP